MRAAGARTQFMKEIRFKTGTLAHVMCEYSHMLLPVAEPYFVAVRAHTEEKLPARGVVYIDPSFMLFAVKTRGEAVSLTTTLPVPELFYDSPYFTQHPTHTEEGVLIRVNDYPAGWYLPAGRTLILSDWTHSFECARVAVELFPRLVERLKLKPLSEKRRIELLREFRLAPRRITVGCDPEFEMWSQRVELQDARDHLDMDGSIGTDGAGYQVELRPRAGTPVEVVRNLRKLFADFCRMFPETDLDAAGNCHACGGHVHVGGVPRNAPGDLINLLDDFVGEPAHWLNGDARGDYGELGDWREQPHGFEYRTPPAAIFANPKIARITLKLVRNLVARFYSGRTIKYEEPPTKDDYVRIGGLTPAEAEYFLGFCSSGVPDHMWIRAAWNLPDIPRPRVEVRFRDQWVPERKEWFRQALQTKGLPKGTRLVLYGLSQDRGNVATIPGIPNVEVLTDPPWAPIAVDGSIWIGLPWCVRQHPSPPCYREFLQAVADAIARYCRRVRRQGGDR